MPRRILPDSQRCAYTTIDGKRCRSHRLPGDYSLCYFHYRQAEAEAAKREPSPVFVAGEILSPDQRLETPEAVNAALTRMFRLVAEGKLSTRHASALGYLGQLILMTLPPMERAAADAPKHRVLGRNPDAAIEELAATLRSSVARAGANGSGGQTKPARTETL